MAAAREFIREILERKTGRIVYPWINAELGKHLRGTNSLFRYRRRRILGRCRRHHLDEFSSTARLAGRMVVAVGAVMMLAVVAAIFFMVRRLMVAPLPGPRPARLQALSNGDYRSALDVTADDEVGRLFQGLESMQNRLGFEVAEARRASEKMSRVKVGLDNVATNVMIADTGNNIIYMNKAIRHVRRRRKRHPQRELPSFPWPDSRGQYRYFP